jgi:cation transport regulator ChaB
VPTAKEDLPDTIKRSAKKVQRTYAKALDNAHEQYDDEERAHRTAYAALKHVAEKKGDHWVLKGRQGPSDPKDRSRNPRVRRSGPTHGGVDANKSRSALYEDAKRAGIEGRSKMSKRQLVNALEKHSKRATSAASS